MATALFKKEANIPPLHLYIKTVKALIKFIYKLQQQKKPILIINAIIQMAKVAIAASCLKN